MKPALIVLSLIVLCLAVVYGVPQYQRSRETARRQRGIEAEWLRAERTPLILDAKTQAILDGADRVETFRLQSGDEDEDESRTSVPAPPTQYFESYPVRQVGLPQNKAFAEALSKALSQASSEPNGVQCYSPGIGFRVWKGAAHRDICVCFHCAALEVLPKEVVRETVPPDPILQNPYHMPTSLGRARPALLALSKQAFPQDVRLAALH